jgi:hypothetical protein
MTTIYKYPIRITDKQLIVSPMCSEIRHVGLDPNGTPCIWVEVATENEDEPWDLYIVGTGNPLPKGASVYVGSFVQGPFVWHAYI